MASKRKAASVDIPVAVRHAGEAGWAYRTETAKVRGRRRRRRAGRPARLPAPSPPTVVAAVAPPPVPAAQGEALPVASPRSVAGRLVGFGLQVAAVPFLVPLYLTVAVSRRLGIGRE